MEPGTYNLWETIPFQIWELVTNLHPRIDTDKHKYTEMHADSNQYTHMQLLNIHADTRKYTQIHSNSYQYIEYNGYA